jgi:hypothetical protein
MPEDTTPLQRREQIAAQLQTYSRRPFLEVLATFLSAAPSQEDIAAFARQYPDRYATAVKAMGGLAGYSTDRQEIEITDLDSLSDSQLRDKLEATLARIRMLPKPAVIEGEAVEDDPVPAR